MASGARSKRRFTIVVEDRAVVVRVAESLRGIAGVCHLDADLEDGIVTVECDADDSMLGRVLAIVPQAGLLVGDDASAG